MMRHLLKCLTIGLGSQEVEPAINLKRIRTDNFSAHFIRDISGQRGFPSSSRANYEKDILHKQFWVGTDRRAVLCPMRLNISRSAARPAVAPSIDQKQIGKPALGCATSPDRSGSSLAARLMFAGFCPADDEPPT